MNKISFFLARPKADTPTAIQLKYRCSDGVLKYPTGISCQPSTWNKDLQNSSDKAIAARLAKFEKAIVSYDRETGLDGQLVTKEGLKRSLDQLFSNHATKTVSQANRQSLFPQWRSLIDGMRDGTILTPSKTKYSAGTIRSMCHHISIIEKFNPKLHLKDIGMKFYNDFIYWCNHQGEEGYSKNYTGTILKHVKTFCKLSGHTLPPDFKKLSEQAYDIYLTEQEIEVIYNLMLKSRDGIVRDWFILDCFIGARVSDLTKLTHDNYDRNAREITLISQKTKEKATIPLRPFATSILNKYKGFPPKVSDQEINRRIKIICEKAGLTGYETYTITKGGEQITRRVRRCDMVSNHTARRSFITNLLRAGVPDHLVMALAGLKSHATLMKYNKATSQQIAQDARKLAIFQAV